MTEALDQRLSCDSLKLLLFSFFLIIYFFSPGSSQLFQLWSLKMILFNASSSFPAGSSVSLALS